MSSNEWHQVIKRHRQKPTGEKHKRRAPTKHQRQTASSPGGPTPGRQDRLPHDPRVHTAHKTPKPQGGGRPGVQAGQTDEPSTKPTEQRDNNYFAPLSTDDDDDDSVTVQRLFPCKRSTTTKRTNKQKPWHRSDNSQRSRVHEPPILQKGPNREPAEQEEITDDLPFARVLGKKQRNHRS